MMISGIWFRSTPRQSKSLKEAWNDRSKDTGVLTISEDKIEFSGKHNHMIITKILSVRFGLAGADPVNPWVGIRYQDQGQVRHAYFADGRFFGYAGALWGTRRILTHIKTLLPESTEIVIDLRYLRNYAVLVLVVILIYLRLFVFNL